MEEYKKTCPVSIILECFGIKRSTFYRWKQECENSHKKDEIADKTEALCMENHFIYGYRTITRLLKKVYNLIVNRKKVYRIMKEKGCLCRVRPKKGPKLGKPYYVTDNMLDRDFQADKPLKKLVTDITYLYFGNCRLYLSSIMLPKWRNLTKDNITDIVKNHIIFYNETRIQRKLNGQSPVEYRKLVA